MRRSHSLTTSVKPRCCKNAVFARWALSLAAMMLGIGGSIDVDSHSNVAQAEQPTGMIGPPISINDGRPLDQSSPLQAPPRAIPLNPDLEASIPLNGGLPVVPKLSDSTTNSETTGGGENFPPPPAAIRVIVLKDGRVVQGKIEERAQGYAVEFGNGAGMVPKELVLAAAGSISEAYLGMRNNYTNPTASERVQLAEWCLTQQLIHEARAEVTAALQLDPSRREARALLVRIEAAANPVDAMSISVSPRETVEGYRASAPVSSAHLSPAIAQIYLRQVQPLLMQRCATAGCHSADSTSELSLRPLISRLDTEQNLGTVLRFVDPRYPDSSRLLTVLREPAAPHLDLLRGRLGEQQRVMLTQWIDRVAEEQSALHEDWNQESGPSLSAPHRQSFTQSPKPNSTHRPQPASPSRPGSLLSPSRTPELQTPSTHHSIHAAVTFPEAEGLPGAIVQSSFEQTAPAPRSSSLTASRLWGPDNPEDARQTPPAGSIRSLPVADRDKEKNQRERQSQPVDEALLRQILREEQHDPFDPEEFNRQMHRAR